MKNYIKKMDKDVEFLIKEFYKLIGLALYKIYCSESTEVLEKEKKRINEHIELFIKEGQNLKIAKSE